MSSNDKTRQKLMESMRKTKAGTAKKTSEETKNANSQPREEKPVAKKEKAVSRKKDKKQAPVNTVNLYQCGRRIWPD